MTRDRLRWICLLACLLVATIGPGCGDRRDVPPTIAEIRAHHAAGRFAETVPALQQLIGEADGETLDLDRLLGVALMMSDGPSTAVWVLRRVAEHPEHTPDDLLRLAQAYGRGGAHREGLETVDRVLELDRGHLGAHLLRINLAKYLKDWPAVVESADHVVALEPRRTMVHFAKAEALLESGLLDDADQALREGRAADPSRLPDMGLETSFCILELRVEQQREAADAVDQRIAGCLERSGSALEVLDLAVAHYDERGDSARTESLLSRALSERPVRFEVRKRLADRFEGEGRPDAAFDLLLEATQLEGVAFQAWLLVAAFHRDQEDYEAAARAVENVLVDHDVVPELVMAEYADDLIRAQEFDKAEEVIGNIDRQVWTSLLRGRLLLERGDARGAMDALQEGIRLWPGNGTARLLAGRAAERLGDFNRAISEYRDSVRSDVESTSAVYELAKLHEEEGRFSSAYFPLNIRLQRNPDDGQAGLELVRITLAADNLAAAEGAMNLLRTNGKEREALLASAMIEKERAGPGAAADVLAVSQLDLSEPEQVPVLAALVQYLIEAGRSTDAVERTGEVVEAGGESAGMWSLRGRALRAAGKGRDARAAYEKSLELAPVNAEALSGLAALAADEGRQRDALDLYDRAFAADRDDMDAAWNAIVLAQSMESGKPKSEESLDARLEALLYAHPRHPDAANLLALRLLEGGGDLDRAADFARRAIRFRGGAGDLATGGRVALARGDATRAVQLLRRSLERQPASPSTRYFLGKALRTAGKPVAARAAIKAALAAGDFDQWDAASEELAELERQVADGKPLID